MAVTAQELNIILSARDKEFSRAMDRANKRVENFSKKAKREFSASSKAMNGLTTAAKRLAPVLAAALSVRAAKNAQMVAVEIGLLSKMANASTTEFQKFAIAARTVGIEQSKAADILKDTTDRVGDFLITGGGPMKDFFEKVAPLVGVTADQFRNLSGPDALQLFVKTLQDAGASQQDMTFFMEAMASDATLLIPLLKDNAAGLKAIGKEADDAGQLMNESAIKGAVELKNKMDALDDKIRTHFINSLDALSTEFIVLKQFVEDYGIPAFEGLVTGAAAAATAIDTVVTSFRAFKGLDGQSDLFGSGDIQELEDRRNKLRTKRSSAQQKVAEILNGRTPTEAGFFDQSRLSNFTGTGLLQRIDHFNTEIDMLGFMIEEMKKEVAGKPNAGNKDGTLKFAESVPGATSLGKISEATDGSVPTSPSGLNLGPGVDVTSDEEADALESLKSSYDSLLNSMVPVAQIHTDFAATLETINAARAAGLTDQETANQLINQARLEMQRAKDEMTGMSAVTDALENGLTNAFMAALEGAQSFKDAIRQTAAAVIKELYRVLVVQQLVNQAMGFMGFTRAPSGNFVQAPGKAHGGQLQAGKAFMTGESGRELFIPSTPGRLLSPAQTNNALQDGGVVVNQSFAFQANGDESVKRIIQTEAPRIAAMTKNQILDARRRGGQMQSVFS